VFARRYHHQNSVIPVTQQLIVSYEQYHQTVIAVETVPGKRFRVYGVLLGVKSLGDRILQITEHD
jgi:UTP--glucose-1-phosphate uridylyltransferase